MPLLATEPDGTARIVAFTPYLWVDTELACRAGREIYGRAGGLAERQRLTRSAPQR